MKGKNMNGRRPLIAGNWKMFKTCPEAVETALQLAKTTSSAKGVDIMIAPPFTALQSVSGAIAKTAIHLGAQNIHWEEQGARTGEISPLMVASLGCEYVIIGHSERRQYFGETDETVNKKLKSAISAGLIPVMCIGETASERELGKTFSTLDKQLLKGLEGLVADRLRNFVIAYEPVWAIGTGKTATTGQAGEVHGHVRALVERTFGKELAKSTRILYGGSVKPANINDLMDMPDIDGALVGGASLDAATFGKIVCYQKNKDCA